MRLVALELTFTTNKKCPLCGKIFPVTKVRSRLKMIRQDTDFNMIFEEVNPLYYAIWFCPHCGYASQDTFFLEISEKSAEKIKTFLAQSEVNIDFSGIRSRAQAIILFKVAIFFAGLIDAPASRMAGLYLRLAWLYREAEDSALELLAMEKALEYYEVMLYKEKFPVGNMNQITADFLVAELYRRTGKKEQAAKAFSRIVSDPKAKNEKRILEMARDA